MKKILDWCEKPLTSPSGFALLFVLGFVADLVWQLSVGRILESLFGPVVQESRNLDPRQISTYFHVLSKVLQEEAAFRYFPIVAAGVLFPGNRRALWFSILAASVWFGFVHYGLRSVPLQGVRGILLSVIFMKSRGVGMSNERGMLGSTAYHLGFDLFFILGVLILGGGPIRLLLLTAL